jgi:hypothetical protein
MFWEERKKDVITFHFNMYGRQTKPYPEKIHTDTKFLLLNNNKSK